MKRATAKAPTVQSSVLAWHKPKCSWCQEPIELIEQAYAGWYEDPSRPYDSRCYGPQVVHAGPSGCSYYLRFSDGHRDNGIGPKGNCGIKDVPVHWLRRAPTAATAIALRRVPGDREANAWQCWLSVVLGLTMPTWNSLSAMHAKKENGTEAIDIVPLSSDEPDLGEYGHVSGVKIYAVHVGGAESLIANAPLPDESVTFDVAINGEAIGVWLQRLNADQPANQSTPTAERGSVEEWKRWYYDDESPTDNQEAPF